MFTLEQIKDYVSNYSIVDSAVYQKDTKEQVLDEEIMLKVKAARLIFNEAYENYQYNKKQYRSTKGFEHYLKLQMEKLSVNKEENNWGENKLIRNLLASNGKYEEKTGGAKDVLEDGKFSIFCGKKKDYGLSYLKLKFRQKGMDIDNFEVKLDTSDFQKNGVSTVIFSFDTKKYMKNDQSTYHYEQADILNQLEQKRKQAITEKDEDALEYYDANIQRIILQNPIEVSPKQWEQLDDNGKMRYMTLKMKEAKVLKDKDAYTYWNSSLQQMEMKQLVSQDPKSRQTSTGSKK